MRGALSCNILTDQTHAGKTEQTHAIGFVFSLGLIRRDWCTEVQNIDWQTEQIHGVAACISLGVIDKAGLEVCLDLNTCTLVTVVTVKS